MNRVCLLLDRPGLAAALTDRGVAANATPANAAVLVAAQGNRPAEATVAELRGRSPAQILLIVGNSEAAVIRALDSGADDSATEATGDPLIAARAIALMRRKGHRLITIGDLVIDTIERLVWRGGRPIDLLPREYRLLLELALHPGAPISRAVLLERVCGIGFDPGTNVLEVHVSRLRAKLDRGFDVALLHTDKGFGYRLAVPPDHFAIEAASAAS